MTDALDERARTHLRVLRRFSDAVDAVDDRWGVPTPCEEWDARDVLEHVIDFHDVMLLEPLGLQPHRPDDDPEERWAATVDALEIVLSRRDLFDGPIEVRETDDAPAATVDAARLVPMLSPDVLVHAWDLARAVRADDQLDPELCARFLAQLPTDLDALAATGLFGPAVAVADGSDVQLQLLARMGRDPHWSPPDL